MDEWTSPNGIAVVVVENIDVIKRCLRKAFPSFSPLTLHECKGATRLLIKVDDRPVLQLMEKTRGLVKTSDAYLHLYLEDPSPIIRQAVAGGAKYLDMEEQQEEEDDKAEEKVHHLALPGGSLTLMIQQKQSSPHQIPTTNGTAMAEGSKQVHTKGNGSLSSSASGAAGVGPEGEGFHFPTLRIEHLRCATPRIILANTPRPTPLETDIFEGHTLLLIRDDEAQPPEPRHHRHMFDGKQRRFNIQVQGRFKRPVKNPYFGGEITSKMELGLLAKGFAKTILGFIRALNPEMHHSFGDDENVQLPHITAPLFQATETFVLTPAGEEPPPLGQNLPVSDQDKLRRAGKLPAPTFDTTSTISFSFHSMFLDLQSWRLVNFPLINSMDLHLMWVKSALRFVVYEPDFNDPNNYHRQATNKYVFLLQIQHSSNDPSLQDDSIPGMGPTSHSSSSSSLSSMTQQEQLPASRPPPAAPIPQRASKEGEKGTGEGGLLLKQQQQQKEEAHPIALDGSTTVNRLTSSASPIYENYFPTPEGEEHLDSSTSSTISSPFFEARSFSYSSLPSLLVRKKGEEKAFTISVQSQPSEEDYDEEDEQREGDETFRLVSSSPSFLPPTPTPPSITTTTITISNALKPKYLVPAWIEVIDRLSTSSKVGKRQLFYVLVLNGRCLFRTHKVVVSLLGNLLQSVPSTFRPNPRSSERNNSRLKLCDLMHEALKRAHTDTRIEIALKALVTRHTIQDKTFLSEGLVMEGGSTASTTIGRGGCGSTDSSPRGQTENGTTNGGATFSSTTTNSSSMMSNLPTYSGSYAGGGGGGGVRTSTSSINLVGLSSSFSSSSQDRVLLSGPVARSLGDYHWVEEYATLSKVALCLYARARDAQASISSRKREHNCRLTIAIRDIVGSKVVPPSDGPYMPGFFWFEVETLGRVYTLMTRSEEDAEAWVNEIKNVVSISDDPGGVGLMSTFATSSIGSTVDSATIAESFLTNPTQWNLGDRLLLNGRRAFLGRESRSNIEGQGPCLIVARVLEYAFTIDSSSGIDELVIFLDSVAALKHVKLEDLPDADKKIFFLNLYHLMILLARLILGAPPLTGLKWCAFFNMASCEVGGDIFSIAELEHNIIRAGAARPKGALFRFILPTSRYGMAMKEPDYRVNFALNCGSLSLPPSVPVYLRECIEEQLDGITRSILDSVCKIDVRSKTITLSKVCQWYQNDFKPNIIDTLLHHLSPNKASVLQQLLEETGGGGSSTKGITFKYLPYTFETRALSRLDEEERG